MDLAKDPILIGVDLGGTWVKVGLVAARTASLLGYRQAPIEAERGPRIGLDRIVALIERTIKESSEDHIDGIGIGATGPVDVQRGLIQNPFTLPGWENVDILRPFQERFNVPLALENDADAAALGEYWNGAGQGAQRLFMITVGTGIGTAMLIDGEIVRGLNGAHSEGGHQILDATGPACYCGAKGCWESLASGTAIARFAREKISAYPESQLLALADGETGRIDARLVADAAKLGDPLANQVIVRAGLYLSQGLINAILLFMPDMVILGGGVMQSIELFMPIIEKSIVDHSFHVSHGKPKIRSAKLGGQAGTLGAAFAILEKLRAKR